jgi:hypothetical protein
LLSSRIAFIEERLQAKQQKYKKNKGNVTQYVFENPTAAVLISIMQFTSATIAEALCLVTVSGQRYIWRCFNLYISLKVVSSIDNYYAEAT